MLKVFPYPITCTVLQFGVGSLLALAMWTLGLYPKPEINGETVYSRLHCRPFRPAAAYVELSVCLSCTANEQTGRKCLSYESTLKVCIKAVCAGIESRCCTPLM